MLLYGVRSRVVDSDEMGVPPMTCEPYYADDCGPTSPPPSTTPLVAVPTTQPTELATTGLMTGVEMMFVGAVLILLGVLLWALGKWAR